MFIYRIYLIIYLHGGHASWQLHNKTRKQLIPFERRAAGKGLLVIRFDRVEVKYKKIIANLFVHLIFTSIPIPIFFILSKTSSLLIFVLFLHAHIVFKNRKMLLANAR